MSNLKLGALFVSGLAAVILLILVSLDGIEAMTVNMNRQEVTFVVLDTEIKRVGFGEAASDLYLVSIQPVIGSSDNYTYSEAQTMQIKDNYLLGNWRSADLYFKIKNAAGTGEVWRGDVGGIRNGFFSWFPHLINAEPTGITVGE